MAEKKQTQQEVVTWLKKLSQQLERLIICQEKRLGGEVLKDFNSKQFLQGGKK